MENKPPEGGKQVENNGVYQYNLGNLIKVDG
jgi:hypothetical protein